MSRIKTFAKQRPNPYHEMVLLDSDRHFRRRRRALLSLAVQLVLIGDRTGKAGASAEDLEQENLVKRIYIGNLAFGATEDDVRTAFEMHGAVASVQIITDRETGQSRGFGFIEMDEDSAAEQAIAAVNGADIAGRNVIVNEARPRPSRDAAAAAAAAAVGAAAVGNYHSNDPSDDSSRRLLRLLAKK